jgi:PKHD-type hydroxylase
MNFYTLPIEHNNNLWSQVYFEKVFSKEECQYIIEYKGKPIHSYIKNTKDETGYIVGSTSTTIEIESNKDTEWLFSKIMLVAIEANKFYNFDISYISDTRRHLYKEGDFHEWHVDIGIGEASKRKLTVVVFLSSEEDYEGGKLVWNPPSKEIPQRQGSVLVFPPYILHRVEPVTKGKRYSLISWINGNCFR